MIQAFAQDQTVARGALRQALRPVTVRQYLKKYVNEGLAGLCAPQQRPRASRLTAEQQAAFRHALLTSFPADHGLQGRICTGHPMRQYLLATWNAT